jgi:hypothetical protein
MDRVWEEIGAASPSEIESQIEILKSHEENVELRKLISTVCVGKNDINKTAAKIMDELIAYEI